jgi:hypothetical protein
MKSPPLNEAKNDLSNVLQQAAKYRRSLWSAVVSRSCWQILSAEGATIQRALQMIELLAGRIEKLNIH